jgi:hypothetical protein
MAFRDKLGHFVRTAIAAPVEAPEAADIGEAQLEDEIDALVPMLPQTFAEIRQQIGALREQRGELLVAGDLDAIAALDRGVARLEIAGQSLAARQQAAAEAQAELDHARRAEAWRALEPHLTAARARRDHRTVLLFEALGEVVDLEAQAEALGIALGDERCPGGPPLTSFVLDRWVAAHTARQSQRAA